MPLSTAKKAEIIEKFQQHPGDTGSPEVQVALLTQRIVELTEHMKQHPKDMPTALEAGTLNGHGIAGLHAALEFLKETGTETIHQKEIGLMRRFLDGIKDIGCLKLYGDFDTDDRAAVVSLNLGDYDSSEVSDELSYTYEISTRPGAHCAPLMHESMGTVDQGMVRFSFSWFNTEEEIDTAIRALHELAEEE